MTDGDMIESAPLNDRQVVDLGGIVSSRHGKQEDDDNSSTSSIQDDGSNNPSYSDNSSQHTGTNSDSASNSGTSNTGSTGRNGADHMFAKDGGALSGARCCFILTLLVAAGALATVVGLTTANNETEDFQVAFDNTAALVIENSNRNVEKVFRSLEVLSITSTSFIKQENQLDTDTDGVIYPDGFFTIPDAELHFGNARSTSGASVVGYSPIVSDALEYPLWSLYSQDHIGWVDESHRALNQSNTVEEIHPDFFRSEIWYIQTYDEQGNVISVDDNTALTCPSRDEVYDPAITKRQGTVQEKPTNGPFSPIWMKSPPPRYDKASNINFNLMQDPVYSLAWEQMQHTQRSTFQDICQVASTWFNPEERSSSYYLYSLVATPARNDHTDNASIVGSFFAVVPWQKYFENVLDTGNQDPVMVVLHSQCGDKAFTYRIQGDNATLTEIANDASQEPYHQYESMAQTAPFAAYGADTTTMDSETGEDLVMCHSTSFTITVYPTEEFESNYKTNEPIFYTLAVLGIFTFTILAFFFFDCMVQRRQTSIMTTALRQNALVSSLFPKNIQKQLMADLDAEAVAKNKSGKAGLRSFLNEEAANEDNPDAPSADGFKSKPIADLFPETTIMFADIAGFTAWSSTREPSAVFTLLEAIYAEFDSIAKRRRVFKVEVVGDCYVAVAGLPDPRPDHAIVMAKFANDCLNRMFKMVRKLEVELGPDTAELGLRVGLHSGPVVAGVLRGDKSRFQLFGDTMNTASRMESNGVPGRIQISSDTAQLLRDVGKEHWLKEREEKVAAKGKGELQTYFLQIDPGARSSRAGSSAGSVTSNGSGLSDDIFAPDPTEVQARRNRVAEWTVEVMAQQLKSIVTMRKKHNVKSDSRETIKALEEDSVSQKAENQTVIDEVAVAISLPKYEGILKEDSKNDMDESLDPDVMEELRSFVQTIASLYNDNPFHSFDHANHVVMSVNKLLSRINAPDLDECTAEEIHDHTYGITSDPITWFACIFSALIHDVDHSGVPNAQLVKEKAPVASLYNGRSVAEQNSFDMSWDLLMEPTYENLRKTIYVNAAEFRRFRQLVVNGVMATDIVDKDMKTLRNNRWDSAFDESKKESESQARLLKATIIIEHLIQASDVAHTMQHWHIYRRWNERFFNECYHAYLDGRAESNPVDNWYKGEMGFFDFYIIPLAKKLQSCGVFGVSSDEYLSYAMQNRKEWEERGEEVVKEMVRNARKKELARNKRNKSIGDFNDDAQEGL